MPMPQKQKTKQKRHPDWPSAIARPAIVKFKAYSARGATGTALHLDANESPWAPPPIKGTSNFNRYPAQQPDILRHRLADLYGVDPAQIMMGRGADEAIEVLLRTFCEADKDSVLICPPTFGYYATSAIIQGAGVVTAPLRADFSYDVQRITKEMCKTGENLKIAFLCSPNNPTGTAIDPKIVEDLCAGFPNCLIVIDEAYVEFSSHDSFADKIETYPNLVILRTLSKAFSLAGVRLGVAIADPRVVDLMLKVLPPYPISRPVENAVLAALAPAAISVHNARIKIWKSERTRVQTQLCGSPYVKKIYPSEANFLLLDIIQADKLLAALKQAQVKIRDFRTVGAGKFRLSIGSPEENDIALSVFKVLQTQSSKAPARIGEAFRTTKETDIAVRVNLESMAGTHIDTGIGFYDHMLEALSKHGKFGLVLSCKGDLIIDAHHTIEDCALALGNALALALGDKAGAGRFGLSGKPFTSVTPMDETQARVAVDLSGRPAMVFNGTFPSDHAGSFPAEMCPHFFRSLAQTMGAAIQIDVDGSNTHHMIEACFKGLGRALALAFKREGSDIASTKGVL